MAIFQKSFLAEKHPLLFAHRGASAEFPENTLPAFQRATEYGIDAFEIDVRLTADDQLVVHHDPDVQRTTGQSGAIRELKLADLEKLNAGYYFTDSGGDFPFRAYPVAIPTLETLFHEFSNIRFNIDLKSHEPVAVEILWKLIQQTKMHGQVLVGSFHHPVLKHFRRISAGTVATSATEREVWQLAAAWLTGTVGFFPLKMDALQLPTRHGKIDLTHPRVIQAAHRHNLAVHYWTVNDPSEMKSLLLKGADGIMTDDPRQLKAVFAAWKTGKR